VRVILNRVKTAVQSADGGNAQLAELAQAAIRAHANLAEQIPLALLLIMLVEVTGASASFVYTLGSLLVSARLANAWGSSRSLGPTTPRQGGAGLTVRVVVAASLLILYRVLIAHCAIAGG
jgi:hypothetical protein